jgi:hypothetical protein
MAEPLNGARVSWMLKVMCDGRVGIAMDRNPMECQFKEDHWIMMIGHGTFIFDGNI